MRLKGEYNTFLLNKNSNEIFNLVLTLKTDQKN